MILINILFNINFLTINTSDKKGAMSGIINNDPSPQFNVLRKLASSSLKIYAYGLLGMEKMAAEESGHLHEKLFKTNGQPVSLRKMIGEH